MSESYVDTILIEANRKTSPAYLAGNDDSKNKWTNDCGSGIKLNIGDQISVHSAYISEIGNEASTIEIKGIPARNNLNEGQTYNSSNTTLVKTLNASSQGDTDWVYTSEDVKNEIRDDTINLTHSYYKCCNGDYHISLPRAAAWDLDIPYAKAHTIWCSYNGSLNGAVESANPYRMERDYSQAIYRGEANGTGPGDYEPPPKTFGTARREITNNGERYTLFVHPHTFNYKSPDNKLWGHRDPALEPFIWYKKTHPYTIQTGFNSPANVANDITNQMDNVRNIETEQVINPTDKDRDNRNFRITPVSRLNEPFPCAFGEGFHNRGAEGYLTYINSLQSATRRIGNATHICESLTDSALGTSGFAGGNYRNALGLKPSAARTALRNGMYVVEASGVLAGLVGARIVLIGNTSTFPSKTFGPQCVFLNRTVPQFTDNINIQFGYWGGAGMTNGENDVMEYDYYYQSCYSTIGYKRPEIQEKGRSVNGQWSRTIDGSWCIGNHIVYPISSPAGGSNPYQIPNVIPTNILWHPDTLLLLKNYFKQQKLYPELFVYDDMNASQQGLIINGSNITLDKSRFLHMNTQVAQPGGPVIYRESGNTTIYMSLPYGAGTKTLTFHDIKSVTVGMMVVAQSADYFPLAADYATGGIQQTRTFVSHVDAALKEVTFTEPLKTSVSNFDYVSLTNNKLGGDCYYATDQGQKAGALFIDFNPDLEENGSGVGFNDGVNDVDVPYEALAYGFGYQYFNASENASCIGFWAGGAHNDPANGVGGLATPFYAGGVVINEPVAIGFDSHFNAYGTCAMLLYNGLAGMYGNNYSGPSEANMKSFSSYMDRGDADGEPNITAVAGPPGLNVNVGQATTVGFTSNYLINEIYVGADNPALSFNASQSRFEFQRLHTAEVVGSNAMATAQVDDSNVVSYKINKRLSILNYSPNFIPYNNVFGKFNASVPYLDRNIVPYSIMDAHGGVFIEDYGSDETNWRHSLWELLGFTYSQFHNDKNNRLVRNNNIELTTSTPTTNALIETTDLRQWTKVLGENGSTFLETWEPERINYPMWDMVGKNPLDQTPIPTPFQLILPELHGRQNFMEVVQSASSTGIIADNLPRKMISPIYLVKSDILSPMYIGGQKGTSSMPVCAVVPKDNGYGDFYTGGEGTIFTNTQQRTIQNISIDICDADGSAARVDDSCCVIFKIQKDILSNKGIADSILKS